MPAGHEEDAEEPPGACGRGLEQPATTPRAPAARRARPPPAEASILWSRFWYAALNRHPNGQLQRKVSAQPDYRFHSTPENLCSRKEIFSNVQVTERGPALGHGPRSGSSESERREKGSKRGGDGLFLDAMLELPGMQVRARGELPVPRGAMDSLFLSQMQFLALCL